MVNILYMYCTSNGKKKGHDNVRAYVCHKGELFVMRYYVNSHVKTIQVAARLKKTVHV